MTTIATKKLSTQLTKVRVRQFVRGTGGEVKDKETVFRRIRKTTLAFPVYEGCCSSTISSRSFTWVKYRHRRWEVRFSQRTGRWELTLPAGNFRENANYEAEVLSADIEDDDH